jgi:hypothetical protein
MILNWTCRHDLACSLGQRFATLNFIEALPIGQTRRAVNRDFATLIQIAGLVLALPLAPANDATLVAVP